PTTTPRPPSSEHVAAFDRNAWPHSIGIPGRNRRNRRFRIFSGVSTSSPITISFLAFLRSMPEVRPLPSAGITRPQRCRVGGGAVDSSRAAPRPPQKLDVQFSRIQLSRRRSPLSGDGRDQRDKIDKPELAVELAAWQRCPAAAAPFTEPMRPNSPHEPAIELVEELSDVSPLVVV